MTRSHVRTLVVCAALLTVLTTSGCGKSQQVGEVEGVLFVKGKPAPRVHLEFIPDVDKGAKGPMSTAQTDAQGRFTLELKEGNGKSSQPGAIVGWHRVVFSDLRLADSATGSGVPIRFGPQYLQAHSTPVRMEVKEGKQVIEIRIP